MVQKAPLHTYGLSSGKWRVACFPCLIMHQHADHASCSAKHVKMDTLLGLSWISLKEPRVPVTSHHIPAPVPLVVNMKRLM